MTVSRPDAGTEEFDATVIWSRNDVDAALVEVVDIDGWEPPGSLAEVHRRPPQRWGRFIGTRPHDVTVAGFPRMQKDAVGGDRLDEQLSGKIHPGTSSLAGRYEVVSTDPIIPLPSGSPGTPWSGMSGAAVLCEPKRSGVDLICGVIRQDRRATGGTRLIATPVSALLADDDFRNLIEQHTGWDPVLEPIEPADLLAPAAPERDLRSPVMLLRADAEAVTFLGRDNEVRTLVDGWCLGGSDACTVRVLTGPGGQGKTRLARHLTESLRNQGWVTGHLRADLTDSADVSTDWTVLGTTDPILLVVDYAELRPHLVLGIIEYLRNQSNRSRLLLLARSDGPWRKETSGPVRACVILAAEEVVELSPLIPRSSPPQDRNAAFTRATAELAGLLADLPAFSGHPQADWRTLAATVRPPDDLTDPRYDSVLTLQMTALTSLLQHGPAPVGAALGEPAEATLIRHEQRYWEETAASEEFRLDVLGTRTLRRAVAVAALCGAADVDEAIATMRKVPGLPPDRAWPAAEWFHSLYPPESGRWWGSLQPDRIAEYYVASKLAEPGISLPSLMANTTAEQQTQIIIVLARAAIAHYNARRTTHRDNVLRTLNAALDTISLHPEALRATIAALPPTHVIATLGLRLAESATRLLRQLAEEDPAVHESLLADSLLSLGVWQSLTNQPTLDANQQAVEVYRRLANANPAARLPDLATALSNLSNSLAEAGRGREAVAASEEALAIDSSLAKKDPVYESRYAASLNTLATRQAEAGDPTSALVTSSQVVAIYHRLAEIDPAAHEPVLARSLSSFGTLLWNEGQWERALQARMYAVRLYQRLTRANRAYEPTLAAQTHYLGNWLWRVGVRDSALLAAEQAVAIYQRLALEDPTVHESGLAISLSALGLRLSDVGRGEEARDVGEQALAIFRRLARDAPGHWEPDLAKSMANLAIRLLRTGRSQEAWTAAREALELHRRLVPSADDDPVVRGFPSVQNTALAWSLWVLAVVGIGTKRDVTTALRAAVEAVEMYGRWTQVEPSRYAGNLRATLTVRADLLDELGRTDEADEIRYQLTNEDGDHVPEPRVPSMAETPSRE